MVPCAGFTTPADVIYPALQWRLRLLPDAHHKSNSLIKALVISSLKQFGVLIVPFALQVDCL